MSARIEIVHQSLDTLHDYSINRTGPVQKKAKNILALMTQYPDQVFSISGPADEIDPAISQDTLIILGGAVREKCIQHRLEALETAGFKEVMISDCITLSKLDFETG